MHCRTFVYLKHLGSQAAAKHVPSPELARACVNTTMCVAHLCLQYRTSLWCAVLWCYVKLHIHMHIDVYI